jgi:transposase
MKQSDRFVGIDISKDNFDVCVLSQEALLEEGRFNNDAQGWQKFAKNLSDRDLCIIEATGSYHVGLALYLVEHDKRVSVVNPLRVKYFFIPNFGLSQNSGFFIIGCL